MLAMISETDRLLGKDLFPIPSPANFEFYISQHDDMDIEKLPLNLRRPKKKDQMYLFLDACFKVRQIAITDSYSKPNVAPFH